jgi:hypothetical protein
MLPVAAVTGSLGLKVYRISIWPGSAANLSRSARGLTPTEATANSRLLRLKFAKSVAGLPAAVPTSAMTVTGAGWL